MVANDNRRNNGLAEDAWKVIRFNTQQIREEMAEYCIPTIAKTVNNLGGLENTDDAPIVYYPTADGIVQQFSLFDRKSPYVIEEEESG